MADRAKSNKHSIWMCKLNECFENLFSQALRNYTKKYQEIGEKSLPGNEGCS